MIKHTLQKGRVRGLQWALAAIALLAACLALAGCSASLPAPSGLAVDVQSDALTWQAVDGATYYVVRLGADEEVTSKTSYSLASLDAGEHELKVRACDASRQRGDSPWSESILYTREEESGIVYTAVDGGTAYEVTRVGTARGDVVIPELYRGLPVVRIADRAFYSSSAVTGVTVGANVSAIGDSAFMNCSSLASLSLPDGVTSIGEYAFQSCRALTAVTLPAQLASIGDFAFRYCRNLVTVEMGSALTSIGESAFSDCDALLSVTLPAGLSGLGAQAFVGCDALERVDLGGIGEIPESAFNGCTALKEIAGGAQLTSIGGYAFGRCTSLASYVLPEQVESIGEHAFSGCTSLSEISLGERIMSIGEGAFEGTPLASEYENGIAYADSWVIGTDGSLKQLSSAELREGTQGIADYAFSASALEEVSLPASVRCIGSHAFYNCDKLVSLSLACVTYIGRYAFAYCEYLGRSAVTLGDSLETIDAYAFYNCPELGFYDQIPFTLPDTLTRIGTRAFDGTYLASSASEVVYAGDWAVGYKSDASVTSITLRTGTRGIADYAFYNCETLTSVTLASSVERIGTAAFYGCTALRAVISNIASSLTEIGDYAFYKCSALNIVELRAPLARIGRSAFYKSGVMEVNIPSTVREIGQYAFYGCELLTSVTFSEGGEGSIAFAPYVFANCSALTGVTLADHVTQLGERMFSRCTALAEIALPAQLTSLGSYAFYGCTSLAKIALPAQLTAVGRGSFYRCTALADVAFGENTSLIGDYAFYGCTSLTALALPQAVREVGDYAFRSCSALTAVVLGGGIERIGAHAFNCGRQLTLFCEAAAAPEGWNARWNSGYRPVLWGCTLSGNAVLAFEKGEGTLSNPTAVNGISDPLRAGYVFGGWRADGASGEQVYTSAQLSEVADGTLLTAVWEDAPAANAPVSESAE